MASAYIRNGLQPRGNPPTYADIQPRAGFLNDPPSGLPKRVDHFVPKIMTMATQRPATMQVLGCKQNPELVVVARIPVDEDNHGVAHQGYGRHQQIGLAYTGPINLPLMPQASSFYAGMNNELPLPK